MWFHTFYFVLFWLLLLRSNVLRKSPIVAQSQSLQLTASRPQMIMSKVNYSFQNKLLLGYTTLWKQYTFQSRVITFNHIFLKDFQDINFPNIFRNFRASRFSPSLLKYHWTTYKTNKKNSLKATLFWIMVIALYLIFISPSVIFS